MQYTDLLSGEIWLFRTNYLVISKLKHDFRDFNLNIFIHFERASKAELDFRDMVGDGVEL